MNNQIQQLEYSNHRIIEKNSVEPIVSRNDIAILLHIFYIDIWKELNSYLDRLEIPYDLYVTVPDHMETENILTIFEDHPDVTIYRTENRGRDVLPFLQVMNIIGTDRYKYICKLHTKKTGESALGNVWRKLLYFDLIGENRTVRDILALFEENTHVGIVTGKNTVLDSERYDYGNTAKIDRLIEASGMLFQDRYYFAGGTMFWTRSELLEPVLELFRSGDLVFEEERGQLDHTVAHAVERFFGIVCQVKGKTIAGSPSHYSALDDDTLDEVAALVLSQQYVGEDVFLSQKQQLQAFRETLEFKEKEIRKLHKIAESMRMKNRLKRILPSKLLSIPKKVATMFKTLQRNPAVMRKVIFYLKRGEIRYLLSKIKEKSRKNLGKNDSLVSIDPAKIFKRFSQSDYLLGNITIDIIIPVYNGYEYLEALFDSIEKHTTSPYRLIVVNDSSPDERVKPYLEERLKRHPTAVFIDHEKNLGFVKSVNEAYTHTSDHFIILNTDTEVPAFWVERLMYPIVHLEKVASTTPFTNAGQIASFPKFIVDNEIFEGMSVNALDAIFREIDPKPFYEEVPTGVGFCMGVNYTLTKEIGFFIEEEFGKGYGEENDWCQRAIQHSYKNLIVPNLFVYHKHGGSFSAEQKAALMKENAAKLLHKHPNYDKDVEAYVNRDPHATLRNILILLAASRDKEGIHLVVDHALGGGANLYAKELTERYREEGKKVLYMVYDFYADAYQFSFDYKTYHFAFSIADMNGVGIFLNELRFSEIFINSLVSFKEVSALLGLLQKLTDISGAELAVPVHDYFPVCPNFTLLDEAGKYCDIPSLERCNICMEANTQEWKNLGNDKVDVSEWRKWWGTLLLSADRIICFSESSKHILSKAYPDLDSKKIEIILHTVPFLPPVEQQSDPEKQKITVGVLGAINFGKGSGILKTLVSAIDKEGYDIDIVLIGEISEYIRSKHFHVTGRYEREELPQLVKTYDIDIFLLPSICPETFSYTTQEIMMMQMPIMVFDIGAPAERVKDYDKGIILEQADAASVIQYLETYRKNGLKV